MNKIKQSCVFTGHRKIAPERLEYVKNKIRREVLAAIRGGCTGFLCGMAKGADISFASPQPHLNRAGEPLPACFGQPDLSFFFP